MASNTNNQTNASDYSSNNITSKKFSWNWKYVIVGILIIAAILIPIIVITTGSKKPQYWMCDSTTNTCVRDTKGGKNYPNDSTCGGRCDLSTYSCNKTTGECSASGGAQTKTECESACKAPPPSTYGCDAASGTCKQGIGKQTQADCTNACPAANYGCDAETGTCKQGIGKQTLANCTNSCPAGQAGSYGCDVASGTCQKGLGNQKKIDCETGCPPPPVDYCNPVAGTSASGGKMCQPTSGGKFMIKCKSRDGDGGGDVNTWDERYMAYDTSTGTMACIKPPEGVSDDISLIWELHQCSDPGTNCDDKGHCLSSNFYYIKPNTQSVEAPNRVVECGKGGYCDLSHANAEVVRACDSTWWSLWGYNMSIPSNSQTPDTDGTWFNFVQECDIAKESNCPPYGSDRFIW